LASGQRSGAALSERLGTLVGNEGYLDLQGEMIKDTATRRRASLDFPNLLRHVMARGIRAEKRDEK
jgi:hypothetical protein